MMTVQRLGAGGAALAWSTSIVLVAAQQRLWNPAFVPLPACLAVLAVRPAGLRARHRSHHDDAD